MIDPPKNSAISRDDWLKALTDAGLDQEDDQQAITVSEFAATFNVHRSSAVRQLDKLVAVGKATRTHKLSDAVDGRRVRMRAYRLLGKPAKKARG